ncbi:hypothetical protein KPL70_014549 [Citrus sinensis]|nr:hypothetical protein KPL70_014549 [Citrus sinensis]
MWLGLVLRAWTCIFNEKLHKKNKMLEKVFRALVAVSLGATIWLIKIVLVKVLASSFYVTTYFNRMKEIIAGQLGGGKWKEVRNVYKSKRKLSMETTASTWSMKRLVSYIKSSGSSTISKTDNYFGKGRIGDYK